MTISLDLATRTVLVTDKSDVDLIDNSVLGHAPIQYSLLAFMWAKAIGRAIDVEITDQEGWAFGADSLEVAEYLQERTSPGSTEVALIKVGEPV